jgi:endonuclease YncB( thermonuclease family)
MYQYSARAYRVVDGDTIYAELDLGFGMMMGNNRMPFKIRVADCYAPELNAKDEAVREKAKEAKAFVENAVFELSSFDLVVVSRKTRTGKEKATFGRWVADVYYKREGKWRNLAEDLIYAGLATREP